MVSWKKIKCNRINAQLQPILCGGQSFRWVSPNEDEYLGVFEKALWQLKQNDKFISFKKFNLENDSNKENTDESLLNSYLRLDVDIKKLYESWNRADPHFKEASEKFYGLRILKQDIIENVFSFICSSNNNISRISGMVEKLCSTYGKVIARLDGKDYYSFPNVSDLTGPNVEQELRTAGFGYRSKFIHQSACRINEVGTSKWLTHIKSLSYAGAKEELMKLPGIGAKVADCICLMSLDHLEAIPVDTHVFQIACKRYLPHLRDKKSVTERVYNEIGDHFRDLYGPLAGWAHTVLFCADLKTFKENPKSRKRKIAEPV